jgi:tripartite-type tricarboxylate transporter receptor subunit TctC
MIRLIQFTLALLASGALLLPASAIAQQYPTHAVRLVVPFPPGGPTDIVGRTIAQQLQDKWGQPVIVENRPGAGAIIGMDAVAKAAPDGYTLLLGSNSLSLNKSLYSKLPFDLDRDFAPVILVARIPNVLVVHPSVPANTVAELVALAKANPGKLNYASVGTGTGPHLFAELFIKQTGVQIVHVPYKGTAPAVNDLLAGQVQIMFDSLATALPNIRAGKLRALGVTSATRAQAARDIPTLAEAGVPGYEATGWFGIAVTGGTPPEIIAKLNTDIARVIATPAVRERLERIGGEVAGGTPEQFNVFIRAEMNKWDKVIRDSHITVE